MNNFEKRKMLDYLIKLLPVTDTNDYSFDDVFDFLCLEFNINRKPYPIDKDDCLELNTQKQKEHFAKLFRKDIIRLIEKIKPRNTFLENQFLTIKKIYQLSNDEYEMFLFLALKDINNIFKNILTVCLTTRLIHLQEFSNRKQQLEFRTDYCNY